MASEQRRNRVTIADIAQRSGVSKGAVSYALNGRPGLSPDTRQRILRIAEESGWRPNSTARALSGSATQVCGLVIARPADTLTAEPFFLELIAGIEQALARRSFGLMIQLVPDVDAEMEVYRRWAAERRVDGVLLVDLLVDDPRLTLVSELELPTVVIGGPEGTEGFSALWIDDQVSMVGVVRYLARLGHRRIGRVAGLTGYRHTASRSEAFARSTEEMGIDSVELGTDYLRQSGARATRQLLTDPTPPTAIVYDNDVLAIAGLGVAHELGLSVPGDVSLVAWDDSPYCEAVHPALTAVRHDIPAQGGAAATALMTLIGDGELTRAAVPPGTLTPRASTGPPAGAPR